MVMHMTNRPSAILALHAFPMAQAGRWGCRVHDATVWGSSWKHGTWVLRRWRGRRSFWSGATRMFPPRHRRPKTPRSFRCRCLSRASQDLLDRRDRKDRKVHRARHPPRS